MNTGRFRTRGICNHVKHNHTITDLKNCNNYYPCGQRPKNEIHLVKHYKNYINRGLEHVPYLEKMGYIIQQRKMLRKKPTIIQQDEMKNYNSIALKTLNNF